jgi:C-terminal processing protease CtpA/Prc
MQELPMYRKQLLLLSLLFVLAIGIAPVLAIGEQDRDIPPADITNDEGGPVIITGEVEYTNPLFTAGVSEPLIILEDQTGFVRRDKDYLFPVESQQLGQITSDFLTSPFRYTLSLPIEPAGNLNDVDHDGEQDTGVMIFAVAYWTNTFGDSYIEERDQYGGGWSTAYASTRVVSSGELRREYNGGRVIIYAPDENQAFPSGFGEDDKLFTVDDPLVTVPQGYTVVNMNTDPFTFDRSARPTIDLIEGEGAQADDFSELSYTEAFDALIEKFRTEYAFTEYYGIDWDAKSDDWRPRFEEAEANNDSEAYQLTLQQFLWTIPDGHISMSLTQTLFDEFVNETDGGLGIAMRETDNNSVIVNYVTEGSPADEEGIELGAEIISFNGTPVLEAVDEAQPWSAPFSTDHVEQLQQLRYATRWPMGTEVEVVYRNPGDDDTTTATMEVTNERESFAFSSFNVNRSGYELPVEYRPVGDYLYVEIASFFDDERLTIQLWERMIRTAKENEAAGIILDMRNNGGGSGFLADQMAAYFFDDELILGNSGIYDEDLGEFYFDPDNVDRYFLPSPELRYDGDVAILVGPNCASACEFFSYNMTLQDRATIIGQYPTAGLGGGIQRFFMPDGVQMQMTIARAVDADGEIHIEGIGVQPDVKVPVNAETLLNDEDAVLRAAIDFLNGENGE